MRCGDELHARRRLLVQRIAGPADAGRQRRLYVHGMFEERIEKQRYENQRADLVFWRKNLRALVAGTERAQMLIAIDTGGVAIIESNLNSVIPYLSCGLRARFGLEHRQGRRGRG